MSFHSLDPLFFFYFCLFALVFFFRTFSLPFFISSLFIFFRFILCPCRRLPHCSFCDRLFYLFFFLYFFYVNAPWLSMVSSTSFFSSGLTSLTFSLLKSFSFSSGLTSLTFSLLKSFSFLQAS